MTNLLLDPGTLKLEYPEASISKVFRVRILGQVLDYHESRTTLVLTKVPNLPKLHVKRDWETTKRKTLEVNILNLLPVISPECINFGTIVFVTGYYDGEDLNVVECYPIKSKAIIAKENINTIIGISNLEEIE